MLLSGEQEFESMYFFGVRMRTIKDLRKLAELNFCDRCFQEYKALIEPTIEGWLLVPLADWRQIDSEITQMVMKNEKVFSKANQ